MEEGREEGEKNAVVLWKEGKHEYWCGSAGKEKEEWVMKNGRVACVVEKKGGKREGKERKKNEGVLFWKGIRLEM